MDLQVKLLTEDAMVPTRATADSAGLDLFSIEEVWVPPATIGEIKTGIAVILPEGSYEELQIDHQWH